MQITGNKISLRDWQVRDVEDFIAWQRAGHAWQDLDAPYYKDDPDDAELERRKEKHRAKIEGGNLPEPREQLVIARDDVLIGMVSSYWISQETNWRAVGIVIFNPAYWGKGYGYEALGLWSQYLFDHHPDFVRLDLRTWSGNVGMMRLAEKLGYQEEARFRMARLVDGQYYDGMGYGVLREEWQGRYPDGFAATLK